MQIARVEPTVFLRSGDDGLRQLVRVHLHGDATLPGAALSVRAGAHEASTMLDSVPADDSVHDVFIPELREPTAVAFTLHAQGRALDHTTIEWTPARHWRVHVVQHSHHDVGYTNLASNVLREHCEFLDSVIDMAAETASFPEPAQFRLVIEQAWSLAEYLRQAPPERVAGMGELLRSGRVELTALFGNMTTELCGPEELVRALYPSQRIARQFGFPIATAEHNDVPGMTWGLAQVLTEAGIRLFCPQLPRYWNWCEPAMQSFWDDAVLFPQGQPGAFWWEAPSGKRVLLWDAHGSGGDVRPDLPELGTRLQAMSENGYPYETVYWPVRGGARDNSPYVVGFCHTVREWNERWAYPQLIVSTNAGFHADLEPELPADLPVFRGELPGQDYPVGSTSTAAATAVNRGNHLQLCAAETLATVAAAATDYDYPAGALAQAYEEALWYDEHTWGHHFPCGPTSQASELEKQVHAYRGAALVHDVTTRALARIADHIQLPGDGLYLVVHNPLPVSRTAVVSTPLREIENCGSVMAAADSPEEPDAPAHLRGVALTDRWHLHPPAEVVAGRFDLVDLATGETIAFQLVDVDSPEDTVPFAPQRHGLSRGGKRYGFFEPPSGLGRDLRFVAQDLPACGYRTYALRPWAEPAREAAALPRSGASEFVIENQHYRLEVDRDSGRIASLIDLDADRELLDPDSPHSLGRLIVRTPDGVLEGDKAPQWRRAATGPILKSLEMTGAAPGHPHVRLTVGLTEGIKRLDLAIRILKDPTPLLDVHLAFPFLMHDPEWRYESVLAAVTPIDDYLPGAYWDAVAVQNWVRVSDGEMNLVWSSLDAPIASLGQLHPGYVSPAHSCFVPPRAHHPPASQDALSRGRLYSLLFANNFGTNFAVSQSGSVLFRYSLTSRTGTLSLAETARIGSEAVTPCAAIFTEPRRPGHLPLCESFLKLDGDYLALLACKQAEDGRGTILRLWNPADETAETDIGLGFSPGAQVLPTSITEDDDGPRPEGVEISEQGPQGFRIKLSARSLATVRLLPRV